MKLIYAKLWLKKYIKYNHNKLDENKLNRAIINLSHRVYKSHGRKGHNVRQNVRATLVEYSKNELANYNVTFEKPLKVNYKPRYAPRYTARSEGYSTVRGIRHILWFLLRIIGLGILVFIIWYVIGLFHS